MFYFVVHHLRWLARIPGLPHFFDSFLLINTWLFRRPRFAAMEALEREVLLFAGVQLNLHRFGGIEFRQLHRPLGHIHGHGLLDVFLRENLAETLIAQGKVRPHHVFPHSGWISFQLESPADVPFAIELLAMAQRKGNQFLDAAHSQD